MGSIVGIGLLSLIRIMTLATERIALHRLGQARYGTLATMGIGFGGASIVLWLLAFVQGDVGWIGSTWFTGAVYALAFALYTAALVKGPVSVVSPWSNATVVLLWMFQPDDSPYSIFGLILFGIGSALLITKHLTKAILWMIASDALLAVARFIDVSHLNESTIAYAASLFTVIGIWMFIPILVRKQMGHVAKLLKAQPGWSFIAATSNAAAYIALFCLLRFLHPASVESISVLASGLTTIVGIYVFHERQNRMKVISSALMTAGSILLIYG